MGSVSVLNPSNAGGVRGVEDWGSMRSSRALSSGAGVVRRRLTAGTGLEPLGGGRLEPLGMPPLRGGGKLAEELAGAMFGPHGARGGAGSASVGALPSTPSVFKLPRAPLFSNSPLQMPSLPEVEAKSSSRASDAAQGKASTGVARTASLPGGPGAGFPGGGFPGGGLQTGAAASASEPSKAPKAQRPPNVEGQFNSRPHGLPLRRVQGSRPGGIGAPSPREQRRAAAAIDGEAPSATPVTGTTPERAVDAAKAAPKDATAPDGENGSVVPPPDNGNAAKCAAIANLQRLFFEEVGRGGDANAAAAAALRRLAEESRPVGDLSPRGGVAGGAQRDHSRTVNLPAELDGKTGKPSGDDLVVREAEEQGSQFESCFA